MRQAVGDRVPVIQFDAYPQYKACSFNGTEASHPSAGSATKTIASAA
jgi:hypothetical protein